MMDAALIEIVAVAPGVILHKQDGHPDRSCDAGTATPWNAVYVQHADGTVAWYGHMKNGSTTTKAVGQPAGTVQEGPLALRQHLIGGAQRGDLGPLHPPALQAHQVQTVQLAPRRLHQPVGHHVIGDHGDGADDRALADTDELMHA